MKPAWDAVGVKYASDKSVAIGDVDCTAAGKILCEAASVAGYPTIKYYKGPVKDLTGGTGEKYTGGRDEEALIAFVEENK